MVKRTQDILTISKRIKEYLKSVMLFNGYSYNKLAIKLGCDKNALYRFINSEPNECNVILYILYDDTLLRGINAIIRDYKGYD